MNIGWAEEKREYFRAERGPFCADILTVVNLSCKGQDWHVARREGDSHQPGAALRLRRLRGRDSESWGRPEETGGCDGAAGRPQNADRTERVSVGERTLSTERPSGDSGPGRNENTANSDPADPGRRGQ